MDEPRHTQHPSTDPIDGEPSSRSPSRRRLLWLAAGGLSLAPVTAVLARITAAQSDSDNSGSGSGHDDGDHDDGDDDDDGDDSSGRGRGRGRGRGGDEPDDDGPDDDFEGEGEGAVAPAEVPAGSLVINIFDDDAFTPPILTIDAGQTVTFVNQDGDDHTATGAEFDTGIIPEQGGVASVTVSTPGVHRFSCLIHPEMVGELRVRDASGNVPAQPAASPVAAGATTVQIINLAFSPPAISVATGSTVAWTNDDSLPHTVTALDGAFDSGVLDPGGGFSWTFNAPGTFAYQCALHPNMQGEVTVTGEPAGDGSPVPAGTPAASGVASQSVDAAPAGDVPVAIVDLAFEPQQVTVAAGATVVWTNTGQIPHTATGEDFDSGALDPSAEFRHTFNDPGTFDYVCAIHPGMTGRVQVDPA